MTDSPAHADRDSGGQTPSLLAPDEPPPFWVHNPDGAAQVLFVCDHATNFIPLTLEQLGLPDEALERHIAYDIGIAPVTKALADAFDAPAVFSHFSRLIVDPNRQLNDPTLAPEISDDTPVPANRDLAPGALEQRLQSFFWPYHAAVRKQLDRMQAAGSYPVLISMHSFTPVMRGRQRPWEIGILWDSDPRLPVPLMRALEARGWTVGDNEPYSGRDGHGYTQHVHGDRRGLANALIELRQDLIDTHRGQGAWTQELIDVFRPLLADQALYQPRKG